VIHKNYIIFISLLISLGVHGWALWQDGFKELKSPGLHKKMPIALKITTVASPQVEIEEVIEELPEHEEPIEIPKKIAPIAKPILQKNTEQKVEKQSESMTEQVIEAEEEIPVIQLTEAQLIKQLPKPIYPRRARQLGIEGCVRVHLLVSPESKIEEIKIISCEGHDMFKKIVLKTIRTKWDGIIRPHRVNNIAVRGWVEISIPFKLINTQ
jgi:TonB family protein